MGDDMTDEERARALVERWDLEEGLTHVGQDAFLAELLILLRAVRAEEREAAARECEVAACTHGAHLGGMLSARRIRARGGAVPEPRREPPMRQITNCTICSYGRRLDRRGGR